MGDLSRFVYVTRPNSKLIGAVSEGWPELLAGLKSLLETGKALEGGDQWPEGH